MMWKTTLGWDTGSMYLTSGFYACILCDVKRSRLIFIYHSLQYEMSIQFPCGFAEWTEIDLITVGKSWIIRVPRLYIKRF